MTVKFTNNASTTVATGINTSATSLTVTSASAFPSLSGADDYCYLTIQQATGTVREVVKATALSTNTFTITRAQDGTSAGTWSAGDIVELRMTAALLTDVIDAATVDGVKSNFQYTPTAGQTVFSGADNSSNTLVINQSGLVNTYMNGVRLVQGTDYTVSAANNTITLTTGATTSDIIDVEVYGNFTGQSGAAVAITGGSITGTAITATTLGASGTATLNTFVSNNSTISGGTINNVAIGGTTQAAGSFSDLTATTSLQVPAGTTAQRPSSPAAGSFRYNTTSSQFEGYSSSWGAISGGGGGGGATSAFSVDYYTANGSTTAFAISQSVSSENNLIVFIEGIFQQQDAYVLSGNTLTFVSAPANGNKILIYSIAAAVAGSNLNIDSMTGDGSDTTLTLSIIPVSENNTQVFIDGVYQNKDTYSISGSTLTFSTAPPTGSAVEVMTMTQTDINVPVDNTITSAKLSGDLVTPGALDVTTGLTVDTTTLVVDATNNRVGIGTSTVNRALEIAGNNNGGAKANYIRITDTDTSATANNQQGGIEFYTSDSGNENVTASIENLYAGSGAGSELTFNTAPNGSAGVTEAMRIDSSGNLLVGGTSSSIDAGSISLEAQGRIRAGRSGGTVLQLNRTTTDGDIAIFYKDGAPVGSIGSISGAYLYIGDVGAVGMGFIDTAVRPTTDGANADNVYDFGHPTVRWDDIYATNGTIQTSDRNEKQDIEELSDAEQRVAVAAKGLLRKFRWIDSVEAKGDDARIHFGIIAQDLQDAFTAEGLDAGRYAMFISSTWTDDDGNEQTRLGVRYSELLAFIISAI